MGFPDPYNAFITQCEPEKKGEGRLSGYTIAIKDNISTRGIPTTCGSRILEGYIPPYNAFAVDRVLAEGAIIVGKTNMDEFGMGNTTENSAYGPTLNPVDTSRVPGGSSGGSGAAVAAGMVRLALGTDTGGSIRCPAAFCGIVGLKPTYGRVSRYGLIAYANSLEQIGPMARSVEDVALLLNVISAYDSRDSTAVPKPYDHAPDPNIQGVRIGLPEEFFGEGVDHRVAATVYRAVERLEEQGAETVPCSMPSMQYALSAYYTTCMSEASSNLGRYDGVRYGLADDFRKHWHQAFQEVRQKGFGKEVRRRVMLGTFALSSGYYGKYYLKAQTARENVRADFARLFTMVDLIAGPTMPTVAFRLGEKSDPLSSYLADILTVPANLAGVPAISVPCENVHGLPTGLQLIGRYYDEERVIDAAYAYEQTTKKGG
ncbi:MAG: Asp-tRNA(Asn)/Glu-tRNA(Gln) amidotransferase subunit GatA [Methanomicrobiales archaeon]|nr:Asp-tRNA(Asn)/Glu-tRNA(Gln) amidotransferase subunit GatA [Methanomicrobiales archaeon]